MLMHRSYRPGVIVLINRDTSVTFPGHDDEQWQNIVQLTGVALIYKISYKVSWKDLNENFLSW